MSLRGSFGAFFLFIASYGQKKWDENDRKIATSTQKAPTARLMENLGSTRPRSARATLLHELRMGFHAARRQYFLNLKSG